MKSTGKLCVYFEDVSKRQLAEVCAYRLIRGGEAGKSAVLREAMGLMHKKTFNGYEMFSKIKSD